MRRLLLSLILALVAGSACGQGGVDAIVAECERQMKAGLCTALIDRAQYPPGAVVVIAGVGRIPLDGYLQIRNADKQMCSLARRYCTEAPSGPQCVTARALWGR